MSMIGQTPTNNLTAASNKSAGISSHYQVASHDSNSGHPYVWAAAVCIDKAKRSS